MPSFSKLLSVALVTLAATSSVNATGLRGTDTCTPPQVWNGRECVDEPMITEDKCGYGQKYDGRKCVEIECRPGQVLNSAGDGCEDEPLDEPMITADDCGYGQKWNERKCVEIECRLGQVLNSAGDGCEDEPLDEPMITEDDCGYGQKWNERKCVEIECRIGQVLNSAGDGCEDEKVEKVECGPGQQLNRGGDGCEDIPTTTATPVDPRTIEPTSAVPAAGPTEKESAEAARQAGMNKYEAKQECVKQCKNTHIKEQCARGRAGKDCRKRNKAGAWKAAKDACIAACKMDYMYQ